MTLDPRCSKSSPKRDLRGARDRRQVRLDGPYEIEVLVEQRSGRLGRDAIGKTQRPEPARNTVRNEAPRSRLGGHAWRLFAPRRPGDLAYPPQIIRAPTPVEPGVARPIQTQDDAVALARDRLNPTGLPLPALRSFRTEVERDRSVPGHGHAAFVARARKTLVGLEHRPRLIVVSNDGPRRGRDVWGQGECVSARTIEEASIGRAKRDCALVASNAAIRRCGRLVCVVVERRARIEGGHGVEKRLPLAARPKRGVASRPKHESARGRASDEGRLFEDFLHSRVRLEPLSLSDPDRRQHPEQLRILAFGRLLLHEVVDGLEEADIVWGDGV